MSFASTESVAKRCIPDAIVTMVLSLLWANTIASVARHRTIGRSLMVVRILLVDDEDGFRYAAAKALRDAGFDVADVSDHRGALNEISSDRKLDVLVTDVVMPNNVNGFALARMARMKRPEIKVIYVTAYDIPTNEADGVVLRKPLTEKEVVAEVQRVTAA